MKKIIFLIVCSCFALSAIAQDVIHMVDGNSIISYIVQITQYEAVYKIKPDTVDYKYVPLSKVNYIQYQNGTKVFYNNEKDQISTVDNSYAFSNKTASPNSIYDNYKLKKMLAYKTDAKSFRTIGLIYGIVSGVVVGLTTGVNLLNVFDVGLASLVGISVGLVGGFIDYWVPFGILSATHYKKARIYSTNLINTNFELGDIQMETGINVMHDNIMNQNGLGVGLTIKL